MSAKTAIVATAAASTRPRTKRSASSASPEASAMKRRMFSIVSAGHFGIRFAKAAIARPCVS